ncbi:MAG: FprA family A-type flavoprotein [Candidatus Aminicenantes bacterium]|nr:MAG: FprA family A-type flavoprotein [Candidatus Aminicenantes bacterium]
MKAISITPNIYWVGGIDWDLRNFHGYLTPLGSTYNSYLILDEKVTLIDTVKHYLGEEMLARISSVISPSKIDYIVANHVEMDHTGSLGRLLQLAPQAKIITSPMGEKGLRRHFKQDWPFQVVQSGESLSLGQRSLTFVHVPMVHWPDSMVTYLPEEEILFSNDAFGQHVASAERYDDELGWSFLRREAAKYYANIVYPFGAQVKKALAQVKQLPLKLICPSHGLIWRSFIDRIVAEYSRWADHEAEEKAVIIYDTMWGSTEKIARSLQSGLEEEGIPVVVRHLKTSHVSDIIPDVLESRLVLLGSPTLNNSYLPTMGAWLTYLKGLRPQQRVGLAFGSFGWSGQAVSEMEAVMKALGWELPLAGINLKYIPDEEELVQVKEKARELARYLKNK